MGSFLEKRRASEWGKGVNPLRRGAGTPLNSVKTDTAGSIWSVKAAGRPSSRKLGFGDREGPKKKTQRYRVGLGKRLLDRHGRHLQIGSESSRSNALGRLRRNDLSSGIIDWDFGGLCSDRMDPSRSFLPSPRRFRYSLERNCRVEYKLGQPS